MIPLCRQTRAALQCCLNCSNAALRYSTCYRSPLASLRSSRQLSVSVGPALLGLCVLLPLTAGVLSLPHSTWRAVQVSVRSAVIQAGRPGAVTRAREGLAARLPHSHSILLPTHATIARNRHSVTTPLTAVCVLAADHWKKAKTRRTRQIVEKCKKATARWEAQEVAATLDTAHQRPAHNETRTTVSSHHCTSARCCCCCGSGNAG